MTLLVAVCPASALPAPPLWVAALRVGMEGQLRSFGPLDATREITFWIEERASATETTGYRAGDERLARWALGQWSRASGGQLRFEKEREAESLIRVYWVLPQGGLYGEARPFQLRGKRGAAIFVRPLATGLGPAISARAGRDPLFRDTIVFLTCLHELGHALGLTHTRDFADIMYTFQAGGNIEEYFLRYRRKLRSRDDIAKESGLSVGDVAQLRRLYSPAERDSSAPARQESAVR